MGWFLLGDHPWASCKGYPKKPYCDCHNDPRTSKTLPLGVLDAFRAGAIERGSAMTDTYTKIVLTVIAGCLVAIVSRDASPVANAQFGLGCDGSPQAPCHIRLIQ
jgi:hypothetical protein